MSETQRCFPDHQGVPGNNSPPTIDGFVEPESFMVWSFGDDPAQVDNGWSGSSLSTFGTDTSIGLGPPLVEFRGVKHDSSDRIFLSFVVRRDFEFDDSDRIILVFRPDFTTANTPGSQNGNERRIDILPVDNGVGAPGGPPDESHTPPGGAITYDFRADRSAAGVEYYRWDTVNSEWDLISPIPTADIKVRSWSLDGGTNQNWSVEVELPTTTAADPGWIDMTGHIGFYFNVIRTSDASNLPTDNENSAIEFAWPRIDYSTDPPFRLIEDPVFGITSQEIPPDWLGEVIIGSGPDCTAVTGVKFDGGYTSIGVVDASNPTGPLGSQIDATTNNTLQARILNDSSTRPGSGISAEFRLANWGLGPGDAEKWNRIPAVFPATNPSAPINLGLAGASDDSGVLETVWDPDPNDFIPLGSNDDHQCMWVGLDSDQDVDFTESSKRRNMNLIGLSQHEQEAEISGVGYERPESGTDHDVMLISTNTPFVRPFTDGQDPLAPVEMDDGGGRAGRRDGSQGSKDLAQRNVLQRYLLSIWQWIVSLFRPPEEQTTQWQHVWVTITDGFRRLDQEVDLDGKVFRLYQPMGSFGYTATHVSPAGAEYSYTISGTDLEQPEPGLVRLKVPHDGSVRIGTSLVARDVEPPSPGGGCLVQLWRAVVGFVRGIIEWLKRLLNRTGNG